MKRGAFNGLSRNIVSLAAGALLLANMGLAAQTAQTGGEGSCNSSSQSALLPAESLQFAGVAAGGSLLAPAQPASARVYFVSREAQTPGVSYAGYSGDSVEAAVKLCARHTSYEAGCRQNIEVRHYSYYCSAHGYAAGSVSLAITACEKALDEQVSLKQKVTRFLESSPRDLLLPDPTEQYCSTSVECR